MPNKDPDLERFGQEVRKRRKAMKLTLEQLAERAGMSSNYLGSIERGQVNPSVSTVNAVADGLGIAPGELVGEVTKLSEPGLVVAQMFEQLAADMKRVVLLLLRAAMRVRAGNKPN